MNNLIIFIHIKTMKSKEDFFTVKKLTKALAVMLLALCLIPTARNLTVSYATPFRNKTEITDEQKTPRPNDQKTPRPNEQKTPRTVSAATADGQKQPRKEKGLNGFFIRFFEERVAKKPIVTQYSDEQLHKLAEEHNVDFYKLRTMLVIQELLKIKGENKELADIKNMKDGEMRKMLYEAKTKYFDPLSKEDKAQLEKEYKEWKKARNAV